MVIASDINEHALSSAKRNIEAKKKTKEIPCILSDGLENIPIEQIDTAIIAGMGTHTILNILKNPKAEKIKKWVIQSNNDFYLLRKTMNELNFQIKKESYLEERGHDYFILEYQKGHQILSEQELKYGLFQIENKTYYQKTLNQKKNILKQLPWYRLKDKKHLYHEIKMLIPYLKKLNKKYWLIRRGC